MTTKKKTVAEKIQDADLEKITIRKGKQDFMFFWKEQDEIIRKLESQLKERFDITGKSKVLTLACRYLLTELETESDVKES